MNPQTLRLTKSEVPTFYGHFGPAARDPLNSSDLLYDPTRASQAQPEYPPTGLHLTLFEQRLPHAALNEVKMLRSVVT